MQIGGISPAVSAASASFVEAGSLANKVGIAMLDNSIENSESMTAELVKAMEMSVNPNVGGNFDMSV